MPWNIITQLVLTVVVGLIQRRIQKRAQAKARARALDAAAIELRVEDSGHPQVLLYGHTAVRGRPVFVETQDDRPAALRGSPRRPIGWAPDPDALGSAGAMPIQSSPDGFDPPGAGDDDEFNQWLFAQYMLGIGQCEPIAANTSQVIRAVWVDEFDFPVGPGRHHGILQLVTPFAGQARAAVTAAIEGRTAASIFANRTRVEMEAWWRRDEHNPWTGIPDLYIALQGRRIPPPTILTSGGTAPSWSASPVRVLLDYMLGGATRPAGSAYADDEGFGWRVRVEDIDAASIVAAEALRVAQSPTAIWSMPFPPDMAAATGETHDTWGSYYMANGWVSASDDGRAETRKIFPGWLTERYQFDGQVSTDTDPREGMRRILDSMPGALLFWSFAGKWKLVLPDPDVVPDEAHALDDDVLVRLPRAVWPDVKDKLNFVKGKYVSAELRFRAHTHVWPAHPVPAVPPDGGQLLEDVIDLPGCIGRHHAISRMATYVLTSRRITFEVETTLAGVVYEPGDVVPLRSRAAGIDVPVRILEVAPTDRSTVEIKALHWVPYDWRMWANVPPRVPEPPRIDGGVCYNHFGRRHETARYNLVSRIPATAIGVRVQIQGAGGAGGPALPTVSPGPEPAVRSPANITQLELSTATGIFQIDVPAGSAGASGGQSSSPEPAVPEGGLGAEVPRVLNDSGIARLVNPVSRGGKNGSADGAGAAGVGSVCGSSGRGGRGGAPLPPSPLPPALPNFAGGGGAGGGSGAYWAGDVLWSERPTALNLGIADSSRPKDSTVFGNQAEPGEPGAVLLLWLYP